MSSPSCSLRVAVGPVSSCVDLGIRDPQIAATIVQSWLELHALGHLITIEILAPDGSRVLCARLRGAP